MIQTNYPSHEMFTELSQRIGRGMVVKLPVLNYLEILEHETKLAKHELSFLVRGKDSLIRNLIDLKAIEDVATNLRVEAQTKASQRITALGAMGSGKSTTLNLMLSTTLIEFFEYNQLFHKWFSFEKTIPAMLCKKYLMRSDDNALSTFDMADIISCPLSEEDNRRITEKFLPRELEVLENIRKYCAYPLSQLEANGLRMSFLEDNWSFLLPCGAKYGCGGLTTNCFNLRFGPWAVRVSVKVEGDVKKQLLRLSEMLQDPGFEQNLCDDQAWASEAEALDLLCSCMCGLSKDNDAEIIRGWKSPDDIKIASDVREHLGKVWVYHGNGQDIQADRIYVRECLMAWVGATDHHNADILADAEASSLCARKHVRCALEAFDVWVPSDVLDEYCCVSDVPGCGDVQPLAKECLHESLLSSKSLIIFSNCPHRDPHDANIVDALCQSGKLQMVLDKPDEYNMIYVDIAEKASAVMFGQPLLHDMVSKFTSQAKKKGIKDSFEQCADSAINRKSLWPFLDQQMCSKIERAEQDHYRGQVKKASSHLEYFNMYPVAFHGLRSFTASDVARLLQSDGCSYTQYMEATSIPALVNLFRRILIEGSASVAVKLTQELGTICELLQGLADLLRPEESTKIKCTLELVLSNKKDRRRLIDIGREEQELQQDLANELNTFRELLRKTVPSLNSERWHDFKERALGSKTGQRQKSACYFVSRSQQASQSKYVANLLAFLFGKVFSDFPKLWTSFTAGLQIITKKFSEKVSCHLRDTFVAMIRDSVFKAFIDARVKVICEAVERKLQKSISQITATYSNQKKNWGIFSVLHEKSQKVLFSHLNESGLRKSEVQVLEAIQSNMERAVHEGIDALLVQPQQILNSMTQEMTFESLCETEFRASLKSVTAISTLCQDDSVRGFLLKLQEKLMAVKTGVADEHMPRDSWSPIRRLAAGQGHLVNGKMVKDQAKGRLADMYVPNSSSMAEADADGLLRCLTYASFQRDDAESVDLLRIRLCDLSLQNLHLFTSILQACPVNQTRTIDTLSCAVLAIIHVLLRTVSWHKVSNALNIQS